MSPKKDAPPSGVVVPASRLHLLDGKALGKLLSPTRLPFPTVAAPPLDGLKVTLPRPRDLSPDAVKERLFAWARKLSTRRDRQRSEAVQMGDDACLDMLGYAQGALIPFTAREGAWVAIEASKQLPGLFESLVGAQVGSGGRTEFQLPAEYPIERLQGARALFLIDVKAARAVDELNPESAEFLKRFGRGATFEAAMKSIAAELVDEESNHLAVLATNLVLTQLVERAQVQVSDALVDEQIRELWLASEAPVLSHKNFSADEQKEALEAWLADALTRYDMTRRIQISVVLHAIAERDNIQVTPEAIREFEQEAGKALGLSSKAMKEVYESELPGHAQAAALHMLVVDHVMKHAQVEFK